ncbi:MAG: Ig-like domain-containing protein, partial [Candidatus Coproplasma sp.]
MKKKLFVCMAIASAFSLGCISLSACSVKDDGSKDPPEHTHTADSEWHTDETNHWHLCTAGDGYEMDKAAHVYDDDQDTTCNTCGYEREVTPVEPEPEPPVHEHTADSEWQTDETNHWHLCTAGDGYEMDKAAHVYDDDQDTTCNTCGYEREVTPEPEPEPPVHEHTADSEWHTDETNHWHLCTAGDGYEMDKAAHVYDDDQDTTCNTCGYEREVIQITVTINGESTVTAGSSITLTATVTPDSITDPVIWTITDGSSLATIDESGVLTAGNSTGTVTVTATVGGVTSAPFGVTINSVVTEDLILTYSYAGNECAAFEWSDATPASASVKYKLASATSYTTLDSQLIRSASTEGYARADVVGLKGGETYEFVITSSSGKMAAVSKSVTAYDRSGYAHFNYTDGVGAYNDDGTPKENAQIIYVTEETKNTVTAKLGSKTYTGIVSILGGLSSSSNPVIIRVLGTIGAATWNQIDYNADKTYSGSNLMPAEVVVGINDKQLPTASNTTQADLIAGGYNTLNTSVWSELIGLDSRAKYTAEYTDSKGNTVPAEYDTIWNNCPIKNANNVTLEGIGEDARLFQWGLTWQYCNSIEVRNLTFEDYTEDACSFEGSVASTTADGFNSKHIWLHHNTFEEGINYWDLTAEQDKHEGDGATDFKQLSYLTTSYNVHHNNHKTGLVGGSDSTLTACVTFHHNYYNNDTSRLPLGRQANMHMYNNYYYMSTGTNMSIRAGAYAFIENCYFESCANPIEIKTGDSKTGAVKLYNNVFSGTNYTANDYIYEVTDRTAVVTNDNIYNQSFDTDASAFYYDATNKVTDVAVMYTAEETKINVPLLAGVQKRNGTTAIDPEGGNQGGGSGESGG